MQELSGIRAEAARLSEAQFVTRYRHAVLVACEMATGELTREPLSDAAPTRPFDVAGSKVRRRAGGTLHHMPSADRTCVAEACPGDDPRRAIAKRALSRQLFVWLRHASPLPRRGPIIIGRVAESDVVLNDYTVSKEHAWYLERSAHRAHAITDRGSTNGTRIGGVRIRELSEHRLEPGDEVSFGRLVCAFFDAASFYRFLRGDAPHGVARQPPEATSPNPSA